jgi:sugar phosphate isomerase/epimerase
MSMKIGFYTSTLNDRPLPEVLDFAKEAGFDAIELDVGGHIKMPDKVASAVEAARAHGLEVSSITLFGNQLEHEPAKRDELHTTTMHFAAAIAAAGVPIFVIFPGRNPTLDEAGNYRAFADYMGRQLAAAPASLSFAIENWPGPHDDFIATTPDGWKQLLDLIPDRRFGLEFDPSHLIRLGVDPFPVFAEVKDRIKILHGKDTAIDSAKLQRVGYHGKGWWRYVLPGKGLLDWTRFLQQARAQGFDDVISIEHEDADFGWPGGDLEARKAGERQALAFLRKTLAEL